MTSAAAKALARAIAAPAPQSRGANFDRAHGVIQSYQPGPIPTVTVKVAGSNVPIVGVRFMAPYTPTPGDPCVLTAKGSDYIVEGVLAGDGAAASLPYPWAMIGASQSTTSATPTDLATVGPSLSIVTGSQVLITLQCWCQAAASGAAAMTVDISGVTVITAVTNNANNVVVANFTTGLIAICGQFLVTGLTPGLNVFVAKYFSPLGSSLTATFQNRAITVQR